jgi:excisionase family DNA binding protein
MEPRDVDPPLGFEGGGRERVERLEPALEPRWLDVDTAAKYLCMTRHAIYHRVNRCQLPFIRDGRRIRFDRYALDRWMSKGVKYGFAEARRHLVLPEDDQRAPVSRIHRVRRHRKAAERRANEIELDIRAGIHGWKSTVPSFAEWWGVYRKTYTPLKSARNRDAQIVAHFLPHFGAKRLDEITKSDIVRYLNLRRTQVTGNLGHKNRRLISESTVRRERGLLQSIFERAIDEGYDIRNPFRGIKRGKDKPRTRVLTLDEEAKLLDVLHPRFQRFVRFALGTGCRLDEIRGIDSRRDIDWIRGTVHVIGKFRKERDVPMQPDARAALEEQLEEEGKLWTQNPQRLREVLAEGCTRARIPAIGPHVLRHTFGTRWLQARGDIYKLSKILGHSSVAVTEAHYAHLLKEDLVAASQQVKISVAPRGARNVVQMPRRRSGTND